MAKYRWNDHTVEAVLWDGANAAEVRQFISGHPAWGTIHPLGFTMKTVASIDGPNAISPGHFIISYLGDFFIAGKDACEPAE